MNWYLKVLRNYAVFRGRARRKEFWYSFLFTSVVLFLLSMVDQLRGTFDREAGIGLLGMVFLLVTFVPLMAVTVRRLHDTNRSGWWVLIGCLPFVGQITILIVLALDSTPGQNRYGVDPKQPTAP